MLAIRLKRVGRSNLAQYRVIVQDARRHPKRGAVIEYLGTYDPHAKTLNVDNDRIKHYLDNGAQPSNAAARLFKANKIKLPKWVAITKNPKRKTKNPQKLRKNQPKEAESGAKSEPKPADESKAEESAEEAKPKESKKANTSDGEPESGTTTEDSDAAKKPEEKANDESDAPKADSNEEKSEDNKN